MRGDRLMKIVLLLQSRGRMSTRELAEQLEVTPRTVSRDLEALGQAGIPIVAHRGRFGGWSLMEGYRSGLTGMTPSETAALLLRASSGPLHDVGMGEHYEAALEKLRAAYPQAERQGADWIQRRLLIDESGWNEESSSVTEALSICQEALWAAHKLRFAYVKEPGGARGVRRVKPLGLVVKRGSWYLVAQERQVVKRFRISRMEAVEELEESFSYPESFDLRTYWAEAMRTFSALLPYYEAKLCMNEEALQAFREERFAHIQHCAPNADGSYHVQVDLETLAFAVRFILGLGRLVRVLDPQELASRIAQEAQSVARQYAADVDLNKK
ncbi:hypothetical protein B9G55_02675 [Saccharibacillus sp. O16]|nr:hypothetical protein B9G55_02675 [Saccharibacillus sp. O16]